MGDVRVAIAGAAGRMGRTLIRAVLDDGECRLVGAIEGSHSPLLGSDAGSVAGSDPVGIAMTSDLASALQEADVLLDFTTPPVSAALAERAADAHIVHVIGTTGFDASEEVRIEAAARRTVVVKSGNMSLGANLLAALVKKAGKVLRDFDVQILEMHHRSKKDAPSGTALLLGRAVAESRGMASATGDRAEMAAQLTAARIGFASLRGGTVVGEHKVVFAGAHERVTLEHIAEDRSVFAYGAITAAKWGRTRRAGLYTMLDVLGLAE